MDIRRRSTHRDTPTGSSSCSSASRRATTGTQCRSEPTRGWRSPAGRGGLGALRIGWLLFSCICFMSRCCWRVRVVSELKTRHRSRNIKGLHPPGGGSVDIYNCTRYIMAMDRGPGHHHIYSCGSCQAADEQNSHVDTHALPYRNEKQIPHAQDVPHSFDHLPRLAASKGLVGLRLSKFSHSWLGVHLFIPMFDQALPSRNFNGAPAGAHCRVFAS